MNVALPAMTVAVAAFFVWMSVRVFNRWDRRATKPVIGLIASLPILYVLSFGPACWLNERGYLSAGEMVDLYRPIISLASDERLPPPLEWYARLGARESCEVSVEYGRVEWTGPHRCKSGLKKLRLAVPQHSPRRVIPPTRGR
jgi:hypothetical protein